MSKTKANQFMPNMQHLMILILILSLLPLTHASGLTEKESTPEFRQDCDTLWSFWIDSDSLDIEYNRMMARYKRFGEQKSQEIISYYGSTLWTRACDLEPFGSTLYVLNLNGLQIFNMSDLELINEVYLGNGIEYALMGREDNYLYVPRADHLYILDVSDPHNPVQVSSLIFSGAIMDVHVENDRLYCGMIRYGSEHEEFPALYIYDVSDPGNPAVIGKYESSSYRKDCRMFTVVGDYIYAINHWDNFMEVISIADETQPVSVGTYPIMYPRNIVEYNDYLYVAGNDTLWVFDITSPASPSVLHIYETPDYYALEVAAGRLYTSFKYDYNGGIQIYDLISDGSLDSIGFYNARNYWYSLDVAAYNLYVPEKWWGFSIADISDPGNPETIASHSYNSANLMGLDVAGDYVYLTNYVSYSGGPSFNGLYTVDASDLQNPVFTDYDYIPGNTNSVRVMDTLAFVAECQPTNIFSLSDPSNPEFLVQYPEEWNQTKDNLARDTILFVTRYGNLDVVDISDPANPELITVDSSWLYMSTMMLHDNLLYVGAHDMGGLDNCHYLLIIDVSDVTNPVQKGELNISLAFPYFSQMIMRKPNLYFTAADGGLFVLDVSDPDMPDIAGSYMTWVEDP